MKRHNASLNTIKTVSPFSHELTETQFFVHSRARYNDFDRADDDDDDGSLVDLKNERKLWILVFFICSICFFVFFL